MKISLFLVNGNYKHFFLFPVQICFSHIPFPFYSSFIAQAIKQGEMDGPKIKEKSQALD